MLWSLFKILFFVALVAALTAGAIYVLENGPSVMIAVAGYQEFELGPLQAVLSALALVVVIYIAFKLLSLLFALLKLLLGRETAIKRYFDRNRERRGNKAMSDALMALASGEGQKALALAGKAEKLLGAPQASNLLRAQAAELVGDRKLAEETYKRLVKDDRTRFVGIRGIMRQKLSEGDTETAFQLAQKAFALRPKNGEIQDTLLQLQAERHDWAGARKTLGSKLGSGTLPREVHRRRDAVLALSEARDVLDAGKSIQAREAAIEANKLSPDLVPAATMAARGYIETDKPRLATRVLKKTWESQPHPELAAAFAEIVPAEDPTARLTRFKELTELKPDDPESHMLLAELNIAAEDFPAARRALGDLAEVRPTARSLSIMAAIERGEGAEEAIVRAWLAKAVTAPRGPQWVCANCNNTESSWTPVCTNCGAFDSLSWTEASTAELAMPTGSDMLPLVVGRAPADEPSPNPSEAAPETHADATPEPAPRS